MRVLVPGGAGFIGAHVVAALLEAGHGVRVLDALLPQAHAAGTVLPPVGDAEFVRGDCRDAATVRCCLDGVDAVSHQAALVGLGRGVADLPSYVACNDLGTAVLLTEMAAAGVRRLVLASSMVVYGEGRYVCVHHGEVVPPPRTRADLDAGRFEPCCPRDGEPLEPGLVDEDARCDPRSGYAVTKLAQEHLAAVWARETGGSAAALRYHNVYGPGMPRDSAYAGVAATFRSALERGEPPQVFEDGGQRRDFVSVRDVARANVAALAFDGPGLRAYNVGSGEPRTVGALADALAAEYGGPAPVRTGEYRLGDVRHVTAATRRLREELGWAPAVGFAEGVRELATAPLRPRAGGSGGEG